MPLPLELRVRKPRSRANSRPTPYPKGGPAKIARGAIASNFGRGHNRTESVEQAIACISPFGPSIGFLAPINSPSPPPSLATMAPLSPFSVNFHAQPVASLTEELLKAAPVRTRVPSDSRREALGWAKRKPIGEKTNIMTKENTTFEAKKSVVDMSGRINTSAAGKENEAHGLLTRYAPSPDLVYLDTDPFF